MNKVRINLIIKSNEYDLLLLERSVKMPNLVKLALRAYIEKSPFEIPLPAYQKIVSDTKGNKRIDVVLCEDKDSDIIDWISRIQKGSRTTVIKLIIRRYMTELDLRQYFDEKSLPIDSSNKERKPKEPVGRKMPDKKDYTKKIFTEPDLKPDPVESVPTTSTIQNDDIWSEMD